MRMRPIGLLLLLGWTMGSCALSIAPPSHWFDRRNHVDSPSLSAFAQADSLLTAYRPGFDRMMGGTLSTALEPITTGFPESGLGNFAADAMRSRASREIRGYVHGAVLDAGSLQRGFDPGPITRASVHELMPYDNTLVIVTLDGARIESLAIELLTQPFVPMSGLRMSVRDGRPGHLLIGRQVVDPDADYLIATSSWLAAGNGPFSSLWNAGAVQDTGVLLRDVFIEAFQVRPTVSPNFDQRVIEADGGN